MSDGICRTRLRASTAMCVWLAVSSVPLQSYAVEISYNYDAQGRVVQVSYPDGAQISYAYDAAGNRTQVSATATVSYCNSIAQGTNCFSPNQQYKLHMANDGNLVMYTAANGYVWDAKTYSTNSNIAMVEDDGNFVVKNLASGVIHWQSGTWGNPGANLSVTDTGDLRLTSATGQLLWSRAMNSWVMRVGQRRNSYDNGVNRIEMLSDGNLAIANNTTNAQVWSTGLAGSTATTAHFRPDGNFVLRNASGIVWQTFTAGTYMFAEDDGSLYITDSNWWALWTNNVGRIKVINTGSSIKSANGAYTLTLQHDHNLVLTGPNGVAWASNTSATDANKLMFQEDGNLVFSGPSGVIFSSGTGGNYDATFEISNEGVIRVVKPSGQVLWSANENYYLAKGASIKSANQQFELAMFGDGNVVLRNTSGTVLWNTQTWNGASGTRFIDGELKVVNGTTTLWSSGTGGNPGATIEVANTGQVIIRSAAGATLWTSNAAAVSYMLTPGQSILSANGLYRLILQGDGNLVLYKTAGGVLWASNTYSGATGVAFEDGNLKVVNGTTTTWQSNTGSNPGATLTVANTGQVIIKTATGTNLWVSNAAQNNQPVATADTASTAHNTAVAINVLANDTDIDLDTLSISAVGTATGGTVSLGQGGVIYTPNSGFSGTDSFTYTLSDGRGGTATGTVTVTVAAAPNTPPVANTDTVSTAHNTAVTISPLSNDTDADGDTLLLQSVGSPAHGTATISGTDVVYTPTTGYSGADSFTYIVSDGKGGTATGTVNVTVAAAANTPPVAVNDTAAVPYDTATTINPLTNDSDANSDVLSISAVSTPAHGWVSLVGTSIIYTPNNGYSGPDSFTYTISDGRGGNATATVSVTVAPMPNRFPVAVNDTVTAPHNTAITINPLSNDSDPDSDPLSISAIGSPMHGSATISGTSIIYTPTTGYGGNDNFTYTISDGRGGTATGTINVIVQPAQLVTIQVTGVSNLRTLANTAGYNGSSSALYEFIVPAGTTITGSSGGGTAISTGTWPVGANLTLIVRGNVYGGGGNGGAGSGTTAGANGGIGGDAVSVQAPIAVNVNAGGTIKGGGGGGGGGSYSLVAGGQRGGGGGGGGFPNGGSSSGGIGSAGNGTVGFGGTVNGGGAGGGPAPGYGGAGGNAGQPGVMGLGENHTSDGGSAGYAIRKNGNSVTVTNAGTITGAQN